MGEYQEKKTKITIVPSDQQVKDNRYGLEWSLLFLKHCRIKKRLLTKVISGFVVGSIIIRNDLYFVDVCENCASLFVGDEN